MNKIVCYVCGTSYPENATQCPICGYVQTAENAAVNSGESGYTYVKGGRFSKANVKKRNQVNAKSAQSKSSVNKHSDSGKQNGSNVWSIVLIIVLMLAILSVAGYIALRFFLPNDFLYEGFGDLSISAEKQEIETLEPAVTVAPTQEPTEMLTESMDCTAVILDTDIIELEGADSTYQINFTLEPAETKDTVSFLSSDATIATVSDSGLITAVGDGSAVITVTCGSVSAQCTVNCTVQKEILLELNRKEITFDTEGQTWALYNGEIAVDDIIWTSDDNSVATIESGKVTAIGNGDTTVFAIYNDQTVACVIHCKFDEKQDESSNITEANGNSSKTYTLFNPYGYADDVTLNVGDQFILKLVDSSMNNADSVQWSVKNENVCKFNDNTVTATGSGMTEVTATCEGKTYTCVVRVN